MLIVVPIFLCSANLNQRLAQSGQAFLGTHHVERQILRMHPITLRGSTNVVLSQSSPKLLSLLLQNAEEVYVVGEDNYLSSQRLNS